MAERSVLVLVLGKADGENYERTYVGQTCRTDKHFYHLRNGINIVCLTQ